MGTDSRCPRCGGAFVCEADTAQLAPCPCFAVRLNDAARALLRAQYDRCVCVTCLRAVQAACDAQPGAVTPPAAPPPAP